MKISYKSAELQQLLLTFGFRLAGQFSRIIPAQAALCRKELEENAGVELCAGWVPAQQREITERHNRRTERQLK